MQILLFDLEAASGDAWDICQFSSLLTDGTFSEAYNRYFTVNAVTENTFAVHGLSAEMLSRLSGGDRFEDRAQEIHRLFERADILCGHNVRSDLGRLAQAFQRTGLTLPKKPYFCTMRHFTPLTGLKHRYNPASPKPPKLTEVCAYLRIGNDDISEACTRYFGTAGRVHDARFDTAAVLLCLQAAGLTDDGFSGLQAELHRPF